MYTDVTTFERTSIEQGLTIGFKAVAVPLKVFP